MKQILKTKLKETLKELIDSLESEREYHEKREDIALGRLSILVELLKEMR